MNMHVDVSASDWQITHHAGNVEGSDRLLTLLMWKHPEQMRFNPRHLPAPRLNISPIVEGYMMAKRNAQQLKKETAEHSPEYKELWDRPVVVPTIKSIQRAVAKHFDVRHMDMISSRRTAKVVWPRQVAIYLCRNLTPNSYPQIGRMFGDRDHTTCLHAVRKVDARLLTDAKLAGDIGRLTELLSPQHEAAQ